MLARPLRIQNLQNGVRQVIVEGRVGHELAHAVEVGELENLAERVLVILEQDRHLVPQDVVLGLLGELVHRGDGCIEDGGELVPRHVVLLLDVQVLVEQKLLVGDVAVL